MPRPPVRSKLLTSRPLVAAVALSCSYSGSALAQETTDKPFRLDEALETDPILRFGLEHRIRFEHLANDFRAGLDTSSTGLFLRTLLSAELTLEPLFLGAELQDSRAYVTDDTPVNQGLTNPFELLQGYVGLRFRGAFQPEDALSLKVGRMTLDLSRVPMKTSTVERATRRLIARNDFRNTINGFNGIDLHWRSREDHFVRFLAAFPVTRLPSVEEELRSNDVVFDVENVNALLWSAFYSSPEFLSGARVDGYVVGLAESDAPDLDSANRRLVTPGLRFYRAPAPNELDFQIETMLQLGTSRASNKPEDIQDLRHIAASTAVAVGYQVAAPWKPRLAVLYDFASGDESPYDELNNRFDPLFGARRFDFGPTSLYGALARVNLHSPGVRFEITPHRVLDAFVAYRLAWLASSTDAWTSAQLSDKSGEAGSFVGAQLEGRVRYQPFPRNLAFEVGGALFSRGDLPREAEGGRSEPAVYGYTQITGAL